MPLIEALLKELEEEAQTTRRVLERVPTDKLGWRPHRKSRSLGQLAMHVAVVPGAVAEFAVQTDPQVPNFVDPSAPTSASELVPMLDKSLETAKRTLQGMPDATFNALWRLMDGSRALLEVPRGAFLRSTMLNHWYHHRGQLSVYLRLIDVPVPSIYGPSADENPMA
jgi:uncharacterized damage-inducible protein DinB